MQMQKQKRLISSLGALAEVIVCGKPVKRWALLRRRRAGLIRIATVNDKDIDKSI